MIIGFTGLAGCGKSTAARHLEQEHNWTRARMADPLKNMLRSLYADMGYTGVEIERRIEGDLKEKGDALLAGRSPRRLMQTLGTDWARKMIAPNFWVLVAARRLTSMTGHIVVEDVRFDNEAEMIRKLGGRVIHIVRDDHTGDTDGLHESEAGVSIHLVQEIWTITGGVDELLQRVTLAATR